MEILALIPARSGSKSVPDKNIMPIAGRPMLAFSIEHALASKYVNRVIVSTDSDKYRQLALSFGAEAPFLRPPEYAGDLSPDIEVFRHALEWLAENENYRPDICIHLRPSCPVRKPTDIDRMIEILMADPELDSVRSLSVVRETPYKMWRRRDDGRLAPLLDDVPEGYNRPRQELPLIYTQNAAIDVVRSKTVLEKNSMTGDHIHGYIMDGNFDIDYGEELNRTDAYMTINAVSRTFCFDIDGVVASLADNNDYSLAGPLADNVALINKLYDLGHHIILFTARGYVTKKDWTELTRRQMQSWGVSHHELLFGKPAADYYIDDKFISIDELKRIFI